jgi:hypothetical protein
MNVHVQPVVMLLPPAAAAAALTGFLDAEVHPPAAR